MNEMLVCPQCSFPILAREGNTSRCWKCRWIGTAPRRGGDPVPIMLNELCRGVCYFPITYPIEGGYHGRPCNPSLAWCQGHLWICVRLVEYEIGDRRSGPFFSYTVLREIESDLSNLSAYESVETLRSPLGHETLSRGFEDVRLFEHRGQLRGIACICDQNPAGRAEQITFSIGEDGQVFDTTIHQSPLAEKNWLPLVEEDRLLFVYALRPFTIVLDEFGKEISRRSFLQGQAPDQPMLSGGSQAVPFLGGYLLVAHERLKGFYQHRFVQLSDRLQAIAISKPFSFKHTGVEFCCGMAQVENNMVLSFGVHDKEAWLCTVPCFEIERLLFEKERTEFQCLV